MSIERTGAKKYTATNDHGGTIAIGDGSGSEFTPVELLLAAIAGCTAIDVDIVTTRRAEPVSFQVDTGHGPHADLVWGYRTPLPESQKIAGLACFYDEKADVYLDGELQERPRTHFA